MNLKRKPKTKKYPSKQTINLVERQGTTTRSKRTYTVVALVTILLLLFAKIAILDRFLELATEQDYLASMQSELTAKQTALMEYNKIEAEYNRFTNNWMTGAEKNLVDRKEVIALIEQEIATTASIERYSVTDNVLIIDLTGITLEATADLVRRLEARQEVEKVEVYTANNQDTAGAVSSVTLAMMLQNEESIRQREATQQAQANAENNLQAEGSDQ